MGGCITVSSMFLPSNFVTVITAGVYPHGLLMLMWNLYAMTIKCQPFPMVP